MDTARKPNSPSYIKGFVLILLLVVPVIIYFSMYNTHNLKLLPYYGPKDVIVTTKNGNPHSDTLYHTIPSFLFTDQGGEKINDTDISGKLYVANFFFTTCPSICPKMMAQLQRVQQQFKGYDGLSILSHTVNPERDTVSVLAAYAAKIKADNGKWHLLTGDKKAIYDLARHGYFVTTEEGDGGPDDFIHSPMLILVDREKRIRGYYDGTDPDKVTALIGDIKALIMQYSIAAESDSISSGY